MLENGLKCLRAVGHPVVLTRPEVQVVRAGSQGLVTCVEVVAPAQLAIPQAQVELVKVSGQVGVDVDRRREHGADPEADTERADPYYGKTAVVVTDLVPLDAVQQLAANDVTPRREVVQRCIGGADVWREQTSASADA